MLLWYPMGDRRSGKGMVVRVGLVGWGGGTLIDSGGRGWASSTIRGEDGRRGSDWLCVDDGICCGLSVTHFPLV